MKADLIIDNAAQLVACASKGKSKRAAEMRDVGIVENGATAIFEGKIVGVGKSKEIHERFESENVIGAKNKTVCPAFVDPHTHIVFAGNRLNEFELKIKGADYLEILASGGGIISTVEQTRETSLAELVEQSRKRLDKMLAHGTCTAEIKTGYGLDTETELKMLDAIAELDRIHPIDLMPTFLPAHAVPPEYKKVQRPKTKDQSRSDVYVDLICEEMIPRAARWFADSHFAEKNFTAEPMRPPDEINTGGPVGQDKSIYHSPLTTCHFFIDVFCEKNAFTFEQSKRVLETGKRHGMKMKAHVDEFTNLGLARWAIENGAVSVDHLDRTSDEEIKLLAQSNTIGIVTPTVNFNFGSCEFADARRMIDAGCAIAVSTDYNPGSAPCPSPALAMAIACRYQKLLPSEALNAATINAAFAVGLGNQIGSLEIGKQADVLILDTKDYREIAYEFGGNLVETVIKNGKKIL
jgi:imidazolonepropionase